MIQTITFKIEVDHPTRLHPEGEFKELVKGELFIGNNHRVSAASCSTGSCKYLVVIDAESAELKAWWPKWLTAKWICCNNVFEWRASNAKPLQDGEDGWRFGRPVIHGNIAEIARLLGHEWAPPPFVTDWKSSVFGNPHTEEVKP